MLAYTQASALSKRVTWPLLLAGFGVGAAGFASSGITGVTLCPFAVVTGHACPGCGMTRAVLALARGDLGLAWFYHPLALVVAAEVSVAVVWWMGTRAGVIGRRPGTTTLVVLALTGLALVTVWVLRWTAGTLPPV